MADVGAGEQVDLHVSEVAQQVGSIAAERGGQVLVNESGDRDASLLLAVPSGTVAEISDFLEERAERVGYELSTWDNNGKVLANVTLDLSDDQAVALRSELEGHLRATDLLSVFVAETTTLVSPMPIFGRH